MQRNTHSIMLNISTLYITRIQKTKHKIISWLAKKGSVHWVHKKKQYRKAFDLGIWDFDTFLPCADGRGLPRCTSHEKKKVIQLEGRKVCALKIACLSRWLMCKGNFSKKGFDLLDLIVWIKPAKKSLLSHILKVSKFRAKCPSYEQYLIASGFEFFLQWINWFWKHWVPTIELKRAFILVASCISKAGMYQIFWDTGSWIWDIIGNSGSFLACDVSLLLLY